MRKRLLALAAALGMAVLTASPAGAVTGNFRNDFAHPFVGLIAFYNSDWVFIHRCTAELLSPTVALTAGHCTNDPSKPSGAVAAHARVWFLQDVGSHFNPATQHDPVTGYPDSCTGTMGNGLGQWCAESSTLFNYGFDNFAGFPNIRDVGIVILDQAIQEPEYASLASAGTVDALATARGTQDTTMRVSGYGLSFSQSTPPKQGNGGGVTRTLSLRIRLEADETFINLRTTLSGGFSVETQGNGADRGGTCNGDSGGPLFWPASSNQVIAVTSWGHLNAGCRGTGFYYRTDQRAVLEWIHSVVGDARWGEITVS
jgi:secreted trypsin-like serine protease